MFVHQRCNVSKGYRLDPIHLTLIPVCATSKICGGVGIVILYFFAAFLSWQFLFVRFLSNVFFLNAFGGIGYTQHFYSEIFRLIDENYRLFSFAPIVKSVFLGSCCLSCRASQLPSLQGFCRLVEMVWFSFSWEIVLTSERKRCAFCVVRQNCLSHRLIVRLGHSPAILSICKVAGNVFSWTVLVGTLIGKCLLKLFSG